MSIEHAAPLCGTQPVTRCCLAGRRLVASGSAAGGACRQTQVRCAHLASVQGVAIEDVPVELFARLREECALLVNSAESRSYVGRRRWCHANLLGGTWSISRRVFESNLQDVRDWLGESQPPTATNAERLALALESSWLSAELSARGDRRLRCVPRLDSHLDFVGDRLVALVACPAFVSASGWRPRRLQPPNRRRASPSGRPRRARFPVTRNFAPALLLVCRGRSSSPMPDASDLRRLDGRRSVWLASLGALCCSWPPRLSLHTFDWRELAVRPTSRLCCRGLTRVPTPLTSMRQLTEILLDERVTDSDRRRSYYLALSTRQRLHRLVELCSISAGLRAVVRRTASSRWMRARSFALS